MLFLLSLLLWIGCSFSAAYVADDKGHDWLLWGLTGLILGPVGLIGAVGLSDKKLRRLMKSVSEQQSLSKPQ